MTLILTIEIHVLQKRAYLTYSAIKVVYTAFTCWLHNNNNNNNNNNNTLLLLLLLLIITIIHNNNKNIFVSFVILN